MKFLSVCSGVESATCAWSQLRWQPVGFSEIEPFCCRLLEYRYQDVPNYGDLTKHDEWDVPAIDVLVGGTPCQSFSVAGLRRGLADARGQLALEYFRLAARLRPRWIVWENVPGALSADGGSAFAAIIGALDELGYGYAWRVLDAQYFGLAQRRKRVFVVGCLGDWRRAAAVLFEPASLRWDPAPSRASREDAAVGALAGTSPGGGWRCGADEAAAGHVVVHDVPALAATLTGGSTTKSNHGKRSGSDRDTLVAHTLNARGGVGRYDAESETLLPMAFGWQNSEHQGDSASEHVTPTLDKSKIPAVAFNLRGREGGAMPECAEVASLRAASGGSSRSYVAGTLRGNVRNNSNPATEAAMHVQSEMGVRRITPTEAERLQGFADGYTAIPKASDSARYKALGNSIAVPVLRWIGARMQAVDQLQGTP